MRPGEAAELSGPKQGLWDLPDGSQIPAPPLPGMRLHLGQLFILSDHRFLTCKMGRAFSGSTWRVLRVNESDACEAALGEAAALL